MGSGGTKTEGVVGKTLQTQTIRPFCCLTCLFRRLNDFLDIGLNFPTQYLGSSKEIVGLAKNCIKPLISNSQTWFLFLRCSYDSFD